MTYNASAADQYMLSVLSDELTITEADNALTALSTLTSVSPGLFPFDRTFVRPDHQKGTDGAAGVRFVVYGEQGIIRMIRIPRSDLQDLDDAIDSVLFFSDHIIPEAA